MEPHAVIGTLKTRWWSHLKCIQFSTIFERQLEKPASMRSFWHLCECWGCEKGQWNKKETCPCPIKYRKPYVTCTEWVVYSIPLTCYIIYLYWADALIRWFESTTNTAQLKIRYLWPFIAEITAARPHSGKQRLCAGNVTTKVEKV